MVSSDISDGLMHLETPKAHVNSFSYQHDLMARLQAALTVVKTNVLRCVEENIMQCTAICLKMNEGCFKKATVTMRQSQFELNDQTVTASPYDI